MKVKNLEYSKQFCHQVDLFCLLVVIESSSYLVPTCLVSTKFVTTSSADQSQTIFCLKNSIEIIQIFIFSNESVYRFLFSIV